MPTAHTSLPLPAIAEMRLPIVPGLGLGISDHALPSQCIVSVRKVAVPNKSYSPTAHTSLPLPVTAPRSFIFSFALGLSTAAQEGRQVPVGVELLAVLAVGLEIMFQQPLPPSLFPALRTLVFPVVAVFGDALENEENA